MSHEFDGDKTYFGDNPRKTHEAKAEDGRRNDAPVWTDPLIFLLVIMITGQPSALTGACRYCSVYYTYSILDAPGYLWVALAGNVILIGVGALIAVHKPVG